jgi:hypothetical protein
VTSPFLKQFGTKFRNDQNMSFIFKFIINKYRKLKAKAERKVQKFLSHQMLCAKNTQQKLNWQVLSFAVGVLRIYNKEKLNLFESITNQKTGMKIKRFKETQVDGTNPANHLAACRPSEPVRCAANRSLSNSFCANFRAHHQERERRNIARSWFAFAAIFFCSKSVDLPFCLRQGQFLIGHVQLVSLIPFACSGQWLLFLLTPRRARFCGPGGRAQRRA